MAFFVVLAKFQCNIVSKPRVVGLNVLKQYRENLVEKFKLGKASQKSNIVFFHDFKTAKLKILVEKYIYFRPIFFPLCNLIQRIYYLQIWDLVQSTLMQY